MPNHTNVVVADGATATVAPAAANLSGGVLILRATGTVDVEGTIDVSSRGLPGGAAGPALNGAPGGAPGVFGISVLCFAIGGGATGGNGVTGGNGATVAGRLFGAVGTGADVVHCRLAELDPACGV